MLNQQHRFQKTIPRYCLIRIIATAMTLLRKAVVSVKKDKMMFSPNQLTNVVSLLMGNVSYILFQPKAVTKDYALLMF